MKEPVEPPVRLQPVRWLMTVIPGLTRMGAYRIARENPEITVHLGRKVFIHEAKFLALVDAGGKALPGGWRKEPE